MAHTRGTHGSAVSARFGLASVRQWPQRDCSSAVCGNLRKWVWCSPPYDCRLRRQQYRQSVKWTKSSCLKILQAVRTDSSEYDNIEDFEARQHRTVNGIGKQHWHLRLPVLLMRLMTTCNLGRKDRYVTLRYVKRIWYYKCCVRRVASV